MTFNPGPTCVIALKTAFRSAQTESPYEAFYYYARNGKVEAVRYGKWKLHIAKSLGWNKKQGEFPVSLYDLEADVSEKNNVASEYPGVVEQLKKMISDFDTTLDKTARSAGKVL